MLHIKLTLLITLSAALHSYSGYHHANAQETLHLQESLLGGYDKQLRPNGTDGENAVKVSISMHIMGIDSVDIKKGTFTPKFFFRQKWIDERIMFEKRRGFDTLRTVQHKIWVPDIYFDSVQDAKFHDVPIPHTLLRISDNGQVLYSQSLTMTLRCPMNLQNYPFDTHLCVFRLESYQYSSDDLKLAWIDYNAVAMEPSASLYDMSFALEKKPHTMLIQFATGNYTALIANVMVKRSNGTTVKSIYIPSTLLVIIAGLCLCLEARATVPRLTVIFGLLILMVLQAHVILDALPPLNYLTVTHDWLITCTLFIVMALIETILVSPAAIWNKGQTDEVGSCPKRSELLRKIDLGFQVLYAASFILFLIIYWSLIHVNTKGDEEYFKSLRE